MTQLYSEDAKERRAAAKAFRDRLQGGGGERLSETERQILWAHCIAQADAATREAIIDGLCAEMLAISEDDGEVPEVSSAIVFLAADPSDPKRRPSERKVVSTLAAILGQQSGLSQSAPSPILADAHAHIFDALYAVPHSEPLADLVGQLHAACRERDAPDGGLHERLLGFVKDHSFLTDIESNGPALRVWLAEGLLRADRRDQDLLVSLAWQNPVVAPGSPQEDVFAAWAGKIGEGVYDPTEAAWKALAEHEDREGDGYDGLRAALKESFLASSEGFSGQMHAKRVQGILEARTADEDLPDLAQDVLAVLCSEPARNDYEQVNSGEGRKALLGHVVGLPDDYRQREDVCATVASCAVGARESLRAEVRSTCNRLARLKSGGAGRASAQDVVVRERLRDAFGDVEDAFRQAVASGEDPYETVRQAVLPQAVDMYARSSLRSEAVIEDILGAEKYEGIIPGKRTLKKGRYNKVLTQEDWEEVYRKGLGNDPASLLIGAEWALAPGEKSLFDPLIRQLISPEGLACGAREG
jgi:hypothetical protein